MRYTTKRALNADAGEPVDILGMRMKLTSALLAAYALPPEQQRLVSIVRGPGKSPAILDCEDCWNLRELI